MINDLWEKTLSILKDEINLPAYELFLKRIIPVGIDDAVLRLQIPSTMSMEYLEDYRCPIESTVSSLVNRTITIMAERDEPAVPDMHIATKPPPPPEAPAYVSMPAPAAPQKPKLFNPRYTFDSFVVGSNNRLCQAASLAVAEAPGKAYNPLFIYGGVGLGKTHLMQAIGHYILSTRPNLNVLYITTDAFLNQVISSIQANRLFEFSNSVKRADLLLVDDIQFLQNKERTQYEFFQIFNTLLEARKQIVITCDSPPKDIAGLEERLVSRLGWGLIADIKPPDYETRRAILQKKIENDGVEVPDGVLELVAEIVDTNIRDLEGAINRIIAYARLNDQEITLEFVEKIIKDIAPEKKRGPLNADHIITTVCRYFNLELADLKGKRRKKEIVLPRRIAMYLCRELTEMSLDAIGKVFSKDHTTVLYNFDIMKKEIEENPTIKQTVENIRNRTSPN